MVKPHEPALVPADAGYWHQRQIEPVVSDGIQVLVAPDSGLRKPTRAFPDSLRAEQQ